MMPQQGAAPCREVTAAVCSWNSVRSIEACLRGLRDNGVGEIIVVDASSTDGTREIASSLADKVITDPGMGLAMARSAGLAAARGAYFLSVGVDNVLPPGTAAAMLSALREGVYAGIGCTTAVREDGTYWAWAMNRYKRLRYSPGERPVIGTPHMYPTALLRKYGFDARMSWSDDGDLCTRLTADGLRVAITDATAYEVSQAAFADIRRRWRMYGKSDWETYRKYAPSWGLRRRLYSMSHPLRKEFLEPLSGARGSERLGLAPFCALITALRYCGWARYAVAGFTSGARGRAGQT